MEVMTIFNKNGNFSSQKFEILAKLKNWHQNLRFMEFFLMK